MTQFTTDIVQALVQKQDINEIFHSHLETAVYTLHDAISVSIKHA